jgi:hypothetical protein
VPILATAFALRSIFRQRAGRFVDYRRRAGLAFRAAA